MSTSKASFGQVEGQDVDLYTLSNGNGVVVKITNYGGTVTSIVVPDKDGGSADVVCGFDTIEGYFSDDYKGNSPYFGCLVGRYAARIKDGKFSSGGGDFQVATNDGPNHLHGGIKGFDKCIWDAEIADEEGASVLKMSLVSPDGDEGYPGTLKVAVEYRLTSDNELRIRYQAETDKATPVSLTNHTYFNLSGFKDKVLDHVFQLSSDKYLEPDETNVPVGQETAVAGTVCDFNTPKRIGDCFEELPLGFEHYYVFSKDAAALEKVAELAEPTSGRKLEVYSSEPGTLFYTGRYTSDALKREDGTPFGQFRALCVETSKYPNGPNIDGAPRSVLEPGGSYDETTVYKFSWA
ncbi:MAG: aldose epimerase family protein [Verrucomicrobiota bacterium]